MRAIRWTSTSLSTTTRGCGLEVSELHKQKNAYIRLTHLLAGAAQLVNFSPMAGQLVNEGCALGRFRSGTDETYTRLATLVAKSFTPGPLVNTTGDNDTVKWTRTGGTHLLEDETGGFRNDGHDLVVFGHPRAFWPPVLEQGTAGSLSWTFSADPLTEDEARDVCRGVGDDTWGARYCFRR